jgi:ubiquinone biosynthesis protein
VLKERWIPTPLLTAEERTPVPILPISKGFGRRTFYVFLNFVGLALRWLFLVIARRSDRKSFAREIRLVFEKMGGLWIKAGQLLSLRIDLFPVEICRELANLQSQALGFPGEIARQIIEQELGGPIERFFDDWDPTPVAAASIAQVHRARLRDEQVWVAIKVQKPLSAELFGRDLVFISWVISAIKLFRIYPHMRWDDGFRELQQIMKEELDFGYEASATRRMRKNLRAHGISVPKVFSKYSTRRVLVTEWFRIVLMADYIGVAHRDPNRIQEWLRENNVNPRRVAVRLIQSFQRQLLEDNLFHGDLHPGNIGLLKDSRIALLDFGTTNFTEADYLRRVRIFLQMLGSNGFARAADMCLMMCASLPTIDIEVVRERCVNVIRSWSARTMVKELPFHDKSFDNITIELMKVLLGYRCTMDWAFLRIHRASSTLDASLIELHPGVNYRRVTEDYFEQAGRRRAAAVVSAVGAKRAATAVGKGFDIQARMHDYVFFQSEAIRRHAQVFQATSNRYASAIAAALLVAQGSVIALALLTLALGIMPAESIAARLPFISAGASLPPLGWPVVLILLAVAARVWFTLSRLRQALQNPDVGIHRQVAATA